MSQKTEKLKLYSRVMPDRLKWAREEAGYSQAAMAKKLNLDQSTIANYESGKREPDIETLININKHIKILGYKC